MRRAIARAAVLVALVGGLTGCGGHSARDRVVGYLHRVNAIQARTAPVLRRVNATYVAFASGHLLPGGETGATATAAAQRALAAARGLLASVHPPADATELRARLLHLYDLDIGLAAETTQLARYQPAAAAALGLLPALDRRLFVRLRTARTPLAQARAVARYAAGLTVVIGRLARLHPPPVLAASDRAQVRRLERARGLAQRLRRAIAQRDTRAVARLLLAFRSGASSPAGPTTGADRSLRAYTRRLGDLNRAAGAVQRAETDLQRRFARP